MSKKIKALRYCTQSTYLLPNSIFG